MINSLNLLRFFSQNNINFFSGVPDSVLKEFTNKLDNLKKIKHYICVNEGSAVSLNIGNYLATKQIGVTYLQNSGLGHIINPIVSIADSKVYNIPLVLLIGWRGAPGSNDEAQHLKQGSITKKILKTMGIKYLELSHNKQISSLKKIITYSKNKKKIIAILVKRNKFEKENKSKIKIKKNNNLSKKFFFENLLNIIKKNTKIISSTGYISRELFNVRKNTKYKNSKDLYLVGGMGHTSSVGLGYSLKTKNELLCIDGDGSSLMHLGSLFSSSYFAKKNFKYFLLNNYCHDSVGGQKTYSDMLNYEKLASSFKFRRYYLINQKENLKIKLKKILKQNGPLFIEIKINHENGNLSRPKNFKKIYKNFIDE